MTTPSPQTRPRGRLIREAEGFSVNSESDWVEIYQAAGFSPIQSKLLAEIAVSIRELHSKIAKIVQWKGQSG